MTIGLENNLAIKISRKTSEVSANNYDKSIGGLLPTVSVSASKSFSEQNVKQQLARDNQINEINNAKTNNLNISPTLNWTIFDGFGMFHTRDRLETEMELGMDDLKIQCLDVGWKEGEEKANIRQSKALRCLMRQWTANITQSKAF